MVPIYRKQPLHWLSILILFVGHCSTIPTYSYHNNDSLECQFDRELSAINIDIVPYTEVIRSKKGHSKKPWTFIVYIAADNDLRNFSIRNIKQMASIGSNDFINIVVQIDIRLTRENKITRRYLIEKNKIIHVNPNDPHSQRMDSGDPKTLVSCCMWAIQEYPAQEYALILWDHGTGCLDPIRGRIISPLELFTYNPSINKLELDRTIGYLDFISQTNDQRGICWDDSTQNYLTNQKLDVALEEIQTKGLKGKRWGLIGLDACLMSMVEIGTLLKKYANIMVGSQEVELGTGWDYGRVLAPFETQCLDRVAFADHIVHMYEAAYHNLTNDYTQSAINLDLTDNLECNIDEIARILIKCLKKQKNNSVKNAIKLSVSRTLCTHFDEPSFKDLHHLYMNLLNNLKLFSLMHPNDTISLQEQLKKTLMQGLQYIDTIVISNKTGKNLRQAHGISIYFPEKKIHSSYFDTIFAKTNKWKTLLEMYLSTQ